MRSRPVVAVAVGLALGVTAGAGPAASANADAGGKTGPAQIGAGIKPETRNTALTAMQDEALAYAKYKAFAHAAKRSGQRMVAGLFDQAAHEERYEHFAEQARLIGLVRSNEDNLRDAIEGEVYESTVLYPGFARQAAEDGCEEAERRFLEVANDERGHAELFRQALEVLTNPNSGAEIPVGERVSAVSIPRREAVCSGQTQQNLRVAMRGEAFAAAKYEVYGFRARQAGLPRLARLFQNNSRTEITEHFAEQASVAGLVGSDQANLRGSVDDELTEATTTYPQYAKQAFENGDHDAARLFLEIARDELRHAKGFQRGLSSVTG